MISSIINDDPINEADVLADIDKLEEVGKPEIPPPNDQQEEEIETPDVETLDEEETEEQPDEKKEEPKEETSLDEALKKQERELKKKYLSTISKLQNQTVKKSHTDDAIETLKSQGFPDEQIEVLKKLSSSIVTDSRIKDIEEAEKKSFLSENKTLTRKELEEIEDIKATFPDMAWESARNLYLAENAPEKLVTVKKKPIIS